MIFSLKISFELKQVYLGASLEKWKHRRYWINGKSSNMLELYGKVNNK